MTILITLNYIFSFLCITSITGRRNSDTLFMIAGVGSLAVAMLGTLVSIFTGVQ